MYRPLCVLCSAGRTRSEEVFDYSAADMTQEKMRDMKSSLAREIGLVFELCFFVMQNSQVRPASEHGEMK